MRPGTPAVISTDTHLAVINIHGNKRAEWNLIVVLILFQVFIEIVPDTELEQWVSSHFETESFIVGQGSPANISLISIFLGLGIVHVLIINGSSIPTNWGS